MIVTISLPEYDDAPIGAISDASSDTDGMRDVRHSVNLQKQGLSRPETTPAGRGDC